MASSEIDQLRAALSRARDNERTYPAALRNQVLQLAQQRQRDGGSVCALATDLGLAPTTVLGWLRGAPVASPFLPVVIRDSHAAGSTLSLLLPGGARVEGLSLEDVVALCRKASS